MASRKDCLDAIAKRTGRKREEVDELAAALDARAQDFQETGLGPDEAYMKAAEEMLKRIADDAARGRRETILNARKTALLNRFYRDTLAAIEKLPAPDWMRKRLARGAARLALEAKLVGVALPLFKGRLSVDGQYVALRHLWIDAGLGGELDRAGLLKIFASRQLEKKWVRELFELNSGADGRPGVTGDAQALAIAKTVQKWQQVAMAAINREGGWVRSYSGFITRSSHDPDRIRRAKVLGWTADALAHIDVKRTFGTGDREAVTRALHAMYAPMVAGDHFDYGAAIEDDLFPNVAAKASAQRELHFKSADDWLAYNEKYGVSNATVTVVNSLRLAARRTALMREFGTRPREAFEALIKNIRAQLQAESEKLLSRTAALQAARESPGADAAARAKVDAELAELVPQVELAAARFNDFKIYTGEGRRHEALGSPAHNRFAQIDGTAAKPANRVRAQIVNNWMAIQRMAKLGRVVVTHFESLMTKVAANRFWGISFARRYASLFSGLTRGLKGSEKRQVLDLLGVGLENRLGQMIAQYDVADGPHGALAKAESWFFRLTGVSSVTDNQRAEHEAMIAAHLGGRRGLGWGDIGANERRALAGYGIGETEWEALRQVEWSRIGEHTYLLPSDARKLSDEQIRAYMAKAPGDAGFGFAGFNPANADDLDRAREDLALRIAAAYSDSAGYAVPQPSAKVRAVMFQNAYAPGSPLNVALRLIYQFKLWPMDMIARTWGREIYGTIGDSPLRQAAGFVELLVGMAAFGTAGEAVRMAIEGKDPIAELENNPFGAIARGLQRSGFGSIFGDFLLGEYDRHGFTPLQQLAGPTISDLDLLADLLWAGGQGRRYGVFSPQAWRERGTDLIDLGRENLPFQNLWFTSLAAETLFWHELQEWINPGYLRRTEQRLGRENGTEFWLGPAETDQALKGERPAFTPQGDWNLASPPAPKPPR